MARFKSIASSPPPYDDDFDSEFELLSMLPISLTRPLQPRPIYQELELLVPKNGSPSVPSLATLPPPTFPESRGASGEPKPKKLESLPQDILFAVYSRLPVPSRARFAAVCSAFRSTARENPQHPFGLQIPFLALIHADPIRFFHLTDDEFYYFRRQPPLADLACREIVGSSDGWLVTISSEFRVHLLNPVTWDQIELPQLHPWFTCLKAVVAFAPTGHGGCQRFAIVMLLNMSPFTIYAREGDSQWRPLGCSGFQDQFVDVAVIKNLEFVAVQHNGRTVSWDLAHQSPKAAEMAKKQGDLGCYDELYIVVSATKETVFLVECQFPPKTDFLVEYQFQSMRVKVFSLDHAGHWSRVWSLGDEVLFVSRGCSVAVSAEEFPKLRRGCINYIREDEENGWEFMVVSLEENRWSDIVFGARRLLKVPVWVMPGWGLGNI